MTYIETTKTFLPDILHLTNRNEEYQIIKISDLSKKRQLLIIKKTNFKIF